MEDLNKQQVILLAILVSIVTSIATGITTVSLVAQAPGQTVTQTINRVVEKTIERVVEVEAPEPEIVVVESDSEKEVVTVVVNENEMIVDAIAQNAGSLIRIYESRQDQAYVALGVVVRSDGMMYVPAQFYNSRRTYFGNHQGAEYPLELVYTDPAQRFVVLIAKDIGDTRFNPVRIGSANELAIGESVVALGGSSNLVVTKGIVSSLNTKTGIVNSETEGDIAAPVVTLINTSVDANQVITGSILVDTLGDVIGVKTGREGAQVSFSSEASLRDAILNLPLSKIPGDLLTSETIREQQEG